MDLLIALNPYGGSVIIASKIGSFLNAKFVLSILKMFGIGNPYCSKFNTIFGVNT